MKAEQGSDRKRRSQHRIAEQWEIFRAGWRPIVSLSPKRGYFTPVPGQRGAEGH